jgi:phosphatidylinositol-3-phosphatase
VLVVTLSATVAILWPRSEAASALGEPTPHLVVIVFENKEYHQVVRSRHAPYITETLIPEGRLFTHYYASLHPSLPNYLLMTSARFGRCVTNACPRPALRNESLFHQMNAAPDPISWKVYAEDMPSNCHGFDTQTYAARHNPALYYRDIGARGDGTCKRFDVPFAELGDDLAAGTLPQFALIVPNIYHDMHSDSPVSRACDFRSVIQSEVCQGDRWLARKLPALLSNGGRGDVTILIAFDEGTTAEGGGGHVLLLEIGPPESVCSGCSVPGTITHQGLLAAIEDWFELPHLSPRTPSL